MSRSSLRGPGWSGNAGRAGSGAAGAPGGWRRAATSRTGRLAQLQLAGGDDDIAGGEAFDDLDLRLCAPHAGLDLDLLGLALDNTIDEGPRRSKALGQSSSAP